MDTSIIDQSLFLLSNDLITNEISKYLSLHDLIKFRKSSMKINNMYDDTYWKSILKERYLGYYQLIMQCISV